MNHYETIFIASPLLAEAKIGEIQTKVESVLKQFNGKVTQWDDWGNRRLSYIIDKHNSGHYVYLTYSAEPKAIAELERTFQLRDDVLKYLTIRLKERKTA